MLAASEEFLRSIRPSMSDDGALDRCHLRVAALEAGMRLFIASPGHAMSSDHPLPKYWIEALVADPDAAGWIRGEAVCKIDAGMPFVGWSINADRRRIDGPAQPGEGHFIKHLGRDL